MPINPHDEVISTISEVLDPMGGEIRLLGRVSDPLINNQSDKEVFFLIPDLHLISPAAQQRFGNYGFNYSDTELLIKLLDKMAILGDSWKSDGSHELLTIQLGDFFDMWMEFPGIAKSEELEKLKDAHNEFRDILYRGQFRGKPCLKATMILGNHDTKNGKPLEEIQFDLKGFNRTEDGRPFLFVTHGDAFDIIETFLPDSIEEFAVYFLGDLTPINNYSVGIRNEVWNKHMDHTGEINKPLGELESAITEPQHLLQTVKGSPRVTPEQPLPSLFCKQIIFPEQAEHRLFKRIYESFERTAEKDLPGQHVRIAAIGHTHRASMILCRPEDGRKPLLLMDVGAWIENCRYPLSENSEIVTEPSAQLGVIHGNDVRIYQIRLIENI